MLSNSVVLGCCAIAILAVVISCGGDDSAPDAGTPEGAFLQSVEFRNDRQWGRLWDTIHPLQQELISREDYIACRSADLSPDFDRVEITDRFEEDVGVPGTDEVVHSVALTVDYKVSLAGASNESTDTIHVIDVDGEWRFILSGLDGEGCPE